MSGGREDKAVTAQVEREKERDRMRGVDVMRFLLEDDRVLADFEKDALRAVEAERDRYRAALERCLAGIENFHATGTRQPTWDFRELSRAREVARAALEGEA